MQSRNLNLCSLLFLNTKQVREKSTNILLFISTTETEKFSLPLSSFSHRGISSPIKALPGLSWLVFYITSGTFQPLSFSELLFLCQSFCLKLRLDMLDCLILSSMLLHLFHLSLCALWFFSCVYNLVSFYFSYLYLVCRFKSLTSIICVFCLFCF